MVHLAFDLLAAAASFAMTAAVYFWRLREAGDRIANIGAGYAVALVTGAVLGAYLLGTANMVISGMPGIGRSILGALAGAIAAIELYKYTKGIQGSTGVVFVPAFATSVAIGRLGCYFSGLDDYTYGTPTSLPWAKDFGDGILRHPVQLYESLAMAAFLGVALIAFARRSPFFFKNGFYLLVLWYAGQRFVWEFLKPYAAVIGPFNVFHFVSLALVGYALVMLTGSRRDHERP